MTLKFDRNDHGDFYIEDEYMAYPEGEVMIPVEEWKEFYTRVVEHHLQLMKEKKTTPKMEYGINAI